MVAVEKCIINPIQDVPNAAPDEDEAHHDSQVLREVGNRRALFLEGERKKSVDLFLKTLGAFAMSAAILVSIGLYLTTNLSS